MAQDKRITELDALTTPNDADLAVVVDDVAGTPTTKKITLANLMAGITVNGALGAGAITSTAGITTANNQGLSTARASSTVQDVILLDSGDDIQIGTPSYANDIKLRSSSGTLMTVLTTGNVGIGTDSPDGKLHVHTASAGAVTANEAADDLVVENGNNGGMSILTPDATNSRIYFGSTTLDVGAFTGWQYNAGEYIMATNKASASILLKTGENATAMTIDGNGDVGIGTAPVTGAQLTLPQEDDAATPTLAFGDGDTGFYESGDDLIAVSVGGSLRWYLTTDTFGSLTTGYPRFLYETATATNPNITPNANDADTGIGSAGADQLSLIAGGVEGIRIAEDTTITGTLTNNWNATGNLTANSNYVMEGYSTGRNVMRSTMVRATGTASATTCTFELYASTDGAGFNASALATETVTEGSGGTRFETDATGNLLTISGISQTLVGVMGGTIAYNTTGTAYTVSIKFNGSGDLTVNLYDLSGNAISWSDIADTKIIQFNCNYITSS